ncbi:lactosylceramide 4-alpha-galactosyltransferase-like [Limulus polyphemus]|uniref:Lactosylceramide 4-alpha-galactosyltransferase-like n=1 Tax=Limulus polyphemus TaxID=6850 RepID=A0ABM1B733_LIMPO|nr:lactosylceramide 4-alpha-galactosyltransferase-like [Limulus polyphemus]
MKNVTKPENMFFFETSGRCHLTTREACSIESAAKHHPTNRIQFLYACKNVSQLKDDKPFQIVSQIENVEFKSLNFKFVLSGTPLANWYESGILNITIKKNNVLSDGLKFVLLKKYGGVAIDSDCITRKPLPNLPAYAGFQTLSVVNNAIIKAQKDSPFLIECMERFVKEYSPTIWCHNGPKLLTRVIQGACEKENKYFAPGFTCYGVHLFPVPAFYPINFSQRKLFFDPSVSESLNKIWKDSYIVHIWNSLVQRQQYKPGEGSPMDHLYKDNCPITYSYIVKQGVGE